MDKKQIKDNFARACEEYLKALCEMFEMPYEQDAWVAGDIGTIACVGDYFISMDEIRYIVDNDITFDEYLQYYDYCLEAHEYGITAPNLENWHKGCPRATKEDFANLRKAKQDFDDLVKETKERLGQVKEMGNAL